MKKTQNIIGVILHILLILMLLFALVQSNTEFEKEESLLAYLIHSGFINHQTAKVLQNNCRLELVQVRKALEDFDLHLRNNPSKTEALSLGRLSKREMGSKFNALHLQVNEILIDCLTEKGFTLPFKRIGLKNSYAKCLGFLFTHHGSYQQRKLAQVLGRPPSSPSPPTTSTPASPFRLSFHPLVKESDSEVTDVDQSSDAYSSEEDMEEKIILTAVVTTALVTFVFAGVVFFFWRIYYGSDLEQGKTDEAPLLTSSLSKHSIASSHKSIVLEDKGETLSDGNQSFNNKLNNETNGNLCLESRSLSNLSVEIQLEQDQVSIESSIENTIDMPPTLLGTMEPLKLPPGRTNPAPVPPPPPPIIKAAPSPSPPPPPPPPHKAAAQLPTLQTNAVKPPPPPPPPALPRGSTRPAPLPQAPVPPPPPPIKHSSGGPQMPPPPPIPHCPRPPKPGPGPPPPPAPPGLKAGPRPPGPGPGPGPPPPPPPGLKAGPRAPPPPGAPRPPPNGIKPPRPGAPPTSVEHASVPKTKLKPFFWDKVPAKPDDSMIWHEIKAGSFQFNEEMIETLFGIVPAKKTEGKKESEQQPKFVKLIDAKKAQNLSILLKALGVTTEEVCDAIEEGNELPTELIQTLLKMAPTEEEELKIRLFDGNLSQLGPAERFLKTLLNIPFAFKRLELLLFMCTLQEETVTLKESFVVLEAACTELRKSRLFLKLLEAVLKTGNRMNIGTFRGGAKAFKLDTLLKLSDVKGVDGKTTLLHFVVLEIIRSEGRRAGRASRESLSISSFTSDDLLVLEDIPEDTDEKLRSMGLEVVSGLGNDLDNVRKAAVIDSDSLAGTVAKLDRALRKAREFLNSDMKSVEDENEFYQLLKSFLQHAEVEVMSLLSEEKRIMALVKSTGDYFHGNTGKDEGLRLFIVVRDFLNILDKVCLEVKNNPKKPN